MRSLLATRYTHNALTLEEFMAVFSMVVSRVSIHPATKVGSVHLTIRDLSQSLLFYTDILGFKLLERENEIARLGAEQGRDLVVLHEEPSAKPAPGTTGLYHFAILVPSRLELARALRNLAQRGYPLQGAADHLVSEALYLSDLDGNGIEIYRDRPRDEWPFLNGHLQMATDPLDMDGVMGTLAGDLQPWAGLPSGTVLGHMHLQVADIPAAETFYTDVIGFDLITRYGSSASFISAGGYHHHLGLNTWGTHGASAPPPGSTGLRHWSLQLPDQAALDAVAARVHAAQLPIAEQHDGLLIRDPSANALLLTVE